MEWLIHRWYKPVAGSMGRERLTHAAQRVHLPAMYRLGECKNVSGTAAHHKTARHSGVSEAAVVAGVAAGQYKL
jgi:hypothetical protein